MQSSQAHGPRSAARGLLQLAKQWSNAGARASATISLRLSHGQSQPLNYETLGLNRVACPPGGGAWVRKDPPHHRTIRPSATCPLALQVTHEQEEDAR